MTDNKTIEAKAEVKEFKVEDFTKAYQELCEKMGWTITVKPIWISRDDGSWSMILQTSIEKFTKLSK